VAGVEPVRERDVMGVCWSESERERVMRRPFAIDIFFWCE
jgi:hypothetical protein